MKAMDLGVMERQWPSERERAPVESPLLWVIEWVWVRVAWACLWLTETGAIVHRSGDGRKGKAKEGEGMKGGGGLKLGPCMSPGLSPYIDTFSSPALCCGWVGERESSPFCQASTVYLCSVSSSSPSPPFHSICCSWRSCCQWVKFHSS